jgi:hypothetical protein
MRHLLKVAILSGAMFGISAQAGPVPTPSIPISSLPIIIQTPGNYYLTNDLTFAPTFPVPQSLNFYDGTPAITIYGSGPVVIDLRRHTLSGPTTAQAIIANSATLIQIVGIQVLSDYVTIENGTISGFSYQIYTVGWEQGVFGHPRRNLILDRVVFQNSTNGVLLTRESNSTVKYCTFQDCINSGLTDEASGYGNTYVDNTVRNVLIDGTVRNTTINIDPSVPRKFSSRTLGSTVPAPTPNYPPGDY